MPRYYLPAIGLSGLLLAGQAGALELGDIRVLSSDGQQFKADIELSDVGQLKPIDIAVKLASQSDFDNANVKREAFLQQLQYDVILNGRDGGVIQVSSPAAVPEQDWNLVLEARWPSGRRLKHYLVQNDRRSFASTNYAESDDLEFVDASSGSESDSSYDDSRLQTYADDEQNVSTEPEYDSSYSDSEEYESAASSSYSTPASTSYSSSASNSNYRMQALGDEQYTVPRGDSLWRIAHRARQTDEVSLYQTMQAIVESNPHAFVDGDIHQLKAGAVLRIPSEQQTRGYSASAAKEVIGAQLLAWDERRGIVRQTDARATAYADESASSNDSPSLSLSATSGSGSAAMSGEDQESNSLLREQLERTLVDLDESQRKLETLGDDVSVRDEELQNLRNQLALRNSQLAELRSKLGDETPVDDFEQDSSLDSQFTDDSDDEQPVIDELPADTEEPDWNDDLGEPEELEFEEVDTTPVDQEETIITEPVNTDTSAKEKSLLDSLPGWAVPAALATLLGGLGWFFLSSRRRRQAELEMEAEEEFDLPEDRSPAPVATRDDYDYSADNYVGPADSYADPADSDRGLDNTVANDSDTGAVADADDNINDPLREADIYMAYGRFPEAADLLTRELETDPDREDLLEKLMEVHAASGDTAAYQAAAARLAELRSGGLSWERREDPESAQVPTPTAEEAEVSIAAAERLIDSGQTYSARMMLDKLVSTGTALEKQQARELLHRLA